MKNIKYVLSVIVLGFIFCSFMSPESRQDLQNYELMLGEFNLEELKATKNKEWFNISYEKYSPNPEALKKLTSEVEKENFHIEVYVGTWCPDSQREFPQLIKLLDQVNFDMDNLKLVGVDRDKVVPNLSEAERKSLNIMNVPTIIILDENGKELNRYVEFAQESLEEDLLKILSRQSYKHVYDF
ncbi:protein with tryparedoxin/glycerophosphodiester phosphodiesterase domains [Psychroflexus torquis ATCC 700755]|uniref:Protein with tryparedoxin/glycerophosphodiester phosphodiesterase domains n=1 Tax=Psychroflexus torquis (strain ATCC 700755 / CIP 106069 / ACAM 623) TaxID=313595 RepID=K4ICM7_PSYTT|nr:thioredoxin family protein [Psychroflexus torquis]AFU67628.1 protein with tryparedoxin/glycerophosphodiester phosphodiesterase domains [Psychroflexus torquis ATCC 700755]